MIAAIRSLTGFGNRVGPSPDQCSTACNLFPEASPKAISGRTSYLHVRLEFHPYPHLILTLFNGYRFGPPHIFTCVSTWTWVDHCGFGSTLPDLRPLKTRFASAPHFLLNLARLRNSPVHSSIGTPSTLLLSGLRLLVNIRFQVLFHSPPGVLFTFPSWYYALSVDICVLPWRVVPPASHGISRVPRYSGAISAFLFFAYQAFTVFGTVSQQFRLKFFAGLMVLNPGKVSFTGLGFFPVRSPLLGVSRLISFPRVT